MGSLKKTRGRRQRKCNADAGPTPDDADPVQPEQPGRFSRPWMAVFLDRALSTADLESACRAADVGMGDYLRARRTDLEFAAECAELDIVLRLATAATVQSKAAAGDWRAARMVAAGELDLRDELLADRDGLPRWLTSLCNKIRHGSADPFVVAALEVAHSLAERLQRQGKAPVGWEPGTPWIERRFTPADVLSIYDANSYACQLCGAISYQVTEYRAFDTDAAFNAKRAQEAAFKRDHDSGWSGDNGYRCPHCKARRGLPWQPAHRGQS